MKTKLLTKTIWLVSLVSLFTDIASEMLYPVMPVFLKSIGFSVVLIGLLEGIAEATAGLSKGYFGNISDKLQKRVPFIRIGYLLSALSKPMMALLTQAWWIFIARTTDRIGKGVRNSARDAMLSGESTPENKGKVFGFHRGMDTLGAAIGPVLALSFLAIYPGKYQWIFLLAFIPGMIAVLMTFFLKDKPGKKLDSTTNNLSFFGFLSYWKESTSYYKVLVTGLLTFTLFNSSDVFLLLFLKFRGFSDLQMIGFYIFYNVLYAIMSYPMGMIADKIGLKKVLMGGIFIFSLVYGVMPLASNKIVFMLLFGFYALYAAATEGISKALITNTAKKEHVATAVGFYSSFSSVCSLIASSVGGVIWYYFSPQVMLWSSAIGALLSIFILLKVRSRL
jgi:MFS family permease